MTRFLATLIASLASLSAFSGCATAQTARDIPAIFEPDHRNGLVMEIEAAIAGAQAELGIVPEAAAAEIARKADTRHAPLDEVAAEYDIVRHRMVALLNVWRRSMSPEAGDALHRGVTTVDIYDTVKVLQLLESTDLMIAEMRAIENGLACLAMEHRDTPMIGRTLGQHALPITFGKKVSVWLAQTRRNIDRLHEVRARLRSSGVLKGAVGSYIGLGEQGMEVERLVSQRLGLDAPEPADWRPARDVFAEYAQVLALIAKSNAGMGGEIYRLQMTDIGEVTERRPTRAVGSSTMPHKRNPSLSGALVYHGRTIPALAGLMLDDVEAIFERDNTSRPNTTLEEITIQGADMLGDARRLIGRLDVDAGRMRDNLDRTDGMIMSQRIVLFLSETMSREEAEQRVRMVASRSLETGQAFRVQLLEEPVIGPALEADIDRLLDPTTSLGLAARQVEATLDWVDTKRQTRGTTPLVRACK